MSNLHDTDYQIQFKSGSSTDVNSTATVNTAVEGEPHWATDTDQLFIFNGTANVRIPTQDANGDITFGDGVAGHDVVITIDGETNDGVLTWMEDEDKFQFEDDISFNGTARIEWAKKAANGATVTGFTTASAVADLQTANDGNLYTATEVAGGGNYLIVDFASITAFNWVRLLAYYDGNSAHNITVQVEITPFDGSAWDTLESIEHQTATGNTMQNHSFFIPSDTAYINSGVVKIKLLHSASTSAGHTLVIDECSLYQ